jgi:L-ascorbate metabolism protein UlaG (beta-lactamase superfamily)
MKITMIGHSTVLIETNGKKILTDPYFGKWGNPAYSRIREPAKTRQDLASVDCVVISHNHWDHIDYKYLRMLKNAQIICSKSTSILINLFGEHECNAIKALECIHIDDITITAVPAVHIAPTIGFIISSEGKNIYFAGDTYYSNFMEDIGRKYKLDIALMPVTTYRIPMTMNGKQAVKATKALKPVIVVPIHLGITPRSPILKTKQTPGQYEELLNESGVASKMILLHDGESYTI